MSRVLAKKSIFLFALSAFLFWGFTSKALARQTMNLENPSSDLFLAVDEVLSQIDQKQSVMKISGWADYDGLKMNILKNQNSLEDLYYCPFPDPVLAQMICSYVKSQNTKNSYEKNQPLGRDQMRYILATSFQKFTSEIASASVLNSFQVESLNGLVEIHFFWGPFDGTQKVTTIECQLTTNLSVSLHMINHSVWKCATK